MPIRGLTDRGPSLPQIGVLRKGAAKPDEKKPGQDLKYFRFVTNDEEAMKVFTDFYGPEPQAIHVFVPFPTTAENFEAWQEAYTAGAMQHRCDGQTVTRWLTLSGKYSDEPKPCPGGCKPTGRLKVVIRELKRLALVNVLTTSIHDIMAIQGSLEALERVRGSLEGVPLILRRVPRMISTPAGDGKRTRREKWLITIEAAPQWVDLQLSAAEQAALPSSPPLALPEWDGEDDDEDIEEPEASSTEAAIRALLLDQGKTEEEWFAYRAKTVAGKTEAELQLLLAKLQTAALKRSETLTQIESAMTDLKDLGQPAAEIDTAISRVSPGIISLDEMSQKQLVAVLESLNSWRDALIAAERAERAKVA